MSAGVRLVFKDQAASGAGSTPLLEWLDELDEIAEEIGARPLSSFMSNDSMIQLVSSLDEEMERDAEMLRSLEKLPPEEQTEKFMELLKERTGTDPTEFLAQLNEELEQLPEKERDAHGEQRLIEFLYGHAIAEESADVVEIESDDDDSLDDDEEEEDWSDEEEDDDETDGEMWSAPEEGIETLGALAAFIEDNRADFDDVEPLLADLKALEGKLTAAIAEGRPWHFEIEYE